MKQINGFFEGQEGFNLYYQGWLPENNPQAIVLIVHGLAEHSGRYAETAASFVKEGYAVFCHNHRGHGLSEGRKGYIKYFATYTRDLNNFMDETSVKYPGIPVFLLGHSIGGTIAVTSCLINPDKIDGLILSAPALQTGDSIKGWQVVLTKILAVIAPKAGVDRLDSSTISKDRAVVDAYRNDDLVYTGKLSARLCFEILKTMKELPQEMVNIKSHVLIIHGAEDRLVSPDGSRKIYETIGSEDKTLKIYEGLYHEIMNEPERDMVYKDITGWIAERLSIKKGD
ncbi:alpha/beta hydrolase [Chloroflexota bacterium]